MLMPEAEMEAIEQKYASLRQQLQHPTPVRFGSYHFAIRRRPASAWICPVVSSICQLGNINLMARSPSCDTLILRCIGQLSIDCIEKLSRWLANYLPENPWLP
jgi:hypothetical protein